MYFAEEGTSGGRVVAAVSRLVDASEQQVHMQLRRALGDQNDLTAYVLLPNVHKPVLFCDKRVH